MTADFMKNGGMVTCGLYNDAVMTCLGNDYAYEEIFSRQIQFQVQENDLLIAISSSGRSQNIIQAINAAKDKNAKVITLTGFNQDNPVS